MANLLQPTLFLEQETRKLLSPQWYSATIERTARGLSGPVQSTFSTGCQVVVLTVLRQFRGQWHLQNGPLNRYVPSTMIKFNKGSE